MATSNSSGDHLSGGPAVESRAAPGTVDHGDSVSAAAQGAAGGLGHAAEVAPASVPWLERVGTFRPLFEAFIAAETEWAAACPFVLALLGDPVVNLFAGQPRDFARALAEALAKEHSGLWRMHSTASNAVGFAANFFARVWPLLNKEPSFRTAVGALLVFAVDIDEVVDRDFQLAAQKASDAGQTETLDFFTRWLGVMIP
eukprot:contig_8811_g2084